MVPKILFIEIAHHFGGSGARLLTILKNFPPQSIGLACLAQSETGKKAREIGINVHFVGRNKFDPLILFRILRVIKNEKYSVFDTQNINSKIFGAAVSLFTPAAFISTLNSNYIQEFNHPLKRWLINTAELITNFRVRYYIAVSEEVQTELIESGVDQNKITLIKNAIELDSAEISINHSRFDDVINNQENPVVAVSVGRLVWIKGHDVLVRAIKSVIKEYPDFKCLVIGDGPAKDNLQTHIENLGLENSILMTGFLSLDEVHYLMYQSSMFIMPSRTEGTPIALLEAAALSRPIIASNVGGIPDVITDHVDGLLVEPDDPGALAEAIINLIEDPDLSNRLGKNAKEKIWKEFSPKVQVEKLYGVYIRAIR